MDLRQFTDLGGDIGRRVSDAINTGDYSQLNRDIRRKVEQAFTGTGYNDGLNGKLYREPDAGFDRYDPEQGSWTSKPPKADNGYRTGVVPVTSKPPKKGGAIAMMIAGYTLTAVFGLLDLLLLLTMAVVTDANAAILTGASAGVLLPFLAGGVILAVAGTRKYGDAKRFASYCNTLAGDSFCTVDRLAAETGRSTKFTVKDLGRMIKKGYFVEGHLDEQGTTFIGTNKTYQQYIQAKESAAKARAQAEAEAQGFRAMPEDLQQVIREGEAYIKTIREANDAIPDEVISNKLYRMEAIVGKIFEYVRENPDQVGQLRRFMSYYMPTTEKLVKAYQQMDEETILGKNMTRAKEEIAETMDTINEAYEKLYDSMYMEMAMDVSSDISVLKTMLAQEGLTKDELKGGN